MQKIVEIVFGLIKNGIVEWSVVVSGERWATSGTMFSDIEQNDSNYLEYYSLLRAK